MSFTLDHLYILQTKISVILSRDTRRKNDCMEEVVSEETGLRFYGIDGLEVDSGGCLGKRHPGYERSYLDLEKKREDELCIRRKRGFNPCSPVIA